MLPGLPVAVLVFCAALEASAQPVAERLSAVFDSLTELPYVESVDEERDVPVRAHLVALGAMQKERGVWRPSESERHDGRLYRYTWRAIDLYPSEQLMEDLVRDLSGDFELRLRYQCEARACGSSAQWANTIFKQRILYGREASQQYRAYDAEVGGRSWRIMLYSSARSSDRQYLHGELLALPQNQ